MTAQPPSWHFALEAIAIVVFVAWVLARYAKACRCDSCKDSYAVWTRSTLQLCRTCAGAYDLSLGRVRRRRSVLRRIWRTSQ